MVEVTPFIESIGTKAATLDGFEKLLRTTGGVSVYVPESEVMIPDED